MNVVALSWSLLAAVSGLVLLAVTVSLVTHLGITSDQVVAAGRAVLQLGAVSLVIVVAMRHVVTSLLLCLLMFAVAVYTTATRTGTRGTFGWVCVALLAGVLPVTLIMFGSGTVPFNGPGIIPTVGIIIGNMMTAHTLLGRRAFTAVRDGRGEFEAALSLGLSRRDAFGIVIDRVLAEALIPNLDQTKTVGLVTLPGAFVGVLLGGGSPLQAGAAQVLVLCGIMAGQACVVAATAELIRRGHDLPADLRTLPA